MKKTIKNLIELSFYFAIGYLGGLVITHFMIIPNLY